MLKRPAISKLVQNYIREHIIKGNLRPGDPLPVQGKIAEELGVSVGSVREAVRALESLGIVEVRHGNGLYVRGLNLDAVLDVLSFSLLFEPSSLRELIHLRRLWESSFMPEVVRAVQKKDIERCHEILAEWEKKVEEAQPDHELDRAFHQTLYQSIGNGLLLKLADIFWQAYQYAETRLFSPGITELIKSTRKKTVEDHRKILLAVEAGNEHLSQELMYKHFEGIQRRLYLAERNME